TAAAPTVAAEGEGPPRSLTLWACLAGLVGVVVVGLGATWMLKKDGSPPAQPPTQVAQAPPVEPAAPVAPPPGNLPNRPPVGPQPQATPPGESPVRPPTVPATPVGTFGVRLDPAQMTIKAGERARLEVVFERKGYQGPIQLQIEGLPQGVDCQPPNIESDQTEPELRL